MTRLRVLQVLPNFGLGGGERVALHLLRGFDPKAIEQATVSLYDEVSPEHDGVLAQLDIPQYFLGKRKGLDLRMISRFDRVLREFRPHVVHTHRYVLRYCLPGLIRRRTPLCVHTVHNPALVEVDRPGRVVHRLAFAAGVVPVAIARAVEDSLRAVYGERDYPLIPNGIPVAELLGSPEERRAWRTRNGFRDEDILLVTLGRLEPQKNQELMLRSFALARRDSPQAHLLLAGDGFLKESLVQLADELELGDSVHFLGFRNDVPQLLGGSDVFVLSSDWEGNPLSVMEAMAAGRPIVSTAVGGVPELVEDDRNGLLVPAGDLELFTAALRRILGDEEARRRLGAGASQHAELHFDVQVMVKAYAELYDRLLSARKGGLDALH